MLPDDATEAGLLGVSFFGGRGLSMPFSGGEWAGLARGVAGSWRNAAIDCDIVNFYNTASPQHTTICPLRSHGDNAHLVRHVYHQVITFLAIAVL